MKSPNSGPVTGVRTKRLARESRPLLRRMKDSLLSSEGSSNISLSVNRTIVSFIPRSAKVRLRSEMSLMRDSSVLLPSSAFEVVGRVWNDTNTDGTSSRCLRTHTGAIRPSGNCGELGCNGDSGERGGREANAEVVASEGVEVEPEVIDGVGEACREKGLVLGRRLIVLGKDPRECCVLERQVCREGLL